MDKIGFNTTSLINMGKGPFYKFISQPFKKDCKTEYDKLVDMVQQFPGVEDLDWFEKGLQQQRQRMWEELGALDRSNLANQFKARKFSIILRHSPV